MKFPSFSRSFTQHNNILFIRTILVLLLSCATIRVDFCFSSVHSSLKEIPLEGNFSFNENEFAARDFGNRYRFPPLAVLHPKSVSDIALTIKHVWDMGPLSRLTVAARGHGHSTRGQAQADQGIVINMRSLREPGMRFSTGRFPYVDVSAGELWINILHESLKYGLAPKSWTDYLHLTVGGTLSNGGISGQAFRHGPQISNIYQLEVVTGKGEVINCSEKQNADLFHGVLGGLGQFGIITRARVSLEPAPKMVKWIRVLYSDFSAFSTDQEYLISAGHTVDYVEGFVYINRTDVLNNWRLSFSPHDPIEASKFISDGRTLYCLELAKHFNPDNADSVNQEIEALLSHLSYIRSTLFMSEVSYVEFLDRVHISELKLRSKGLWDIPHPWLNLLIPRSKIKVFAQGVFGNILRNTSNGPVLIYPVNRSKWDNRTSFVLPEEEEDIFYMVAILFHATTTGTTTDGLEYLLSLNKIILDFCEVAQLGVKQYLGLYSTQEQWQDHFGQQRWQVFVQRKLAYDPLAILAPGQRIFQKGISIL